MSRPHPPRPPVDPVIASRAEEDREDARALPAKPLIPGCPELEALVVEASQHRFVRDGFGTAHRVRGVRVTVPGSRRPWRLSATLRRRFGRVTSSVVVEAPIRGIPVLYADTAFAASDALATAVGVELVHRFGPATSSPAPAALVALASTRSVVRLAVHGDRFTRAIAAVAVRELGALLDLLRDRVAAPRPRTRLSRDERDAVWDLVDRTEILEREGDSAFNRFRDALAAWRAPLHTAARVWRSGAVDDRLEISNRAGVVEVVRAGSPWPDLVVRSGAPPPDVAASGATGPSDPTLVRVLGARLARSDEWFSAPGGWPIRCRAEFAFTRGVSRLIVTPEKRADAKVVAEDERVLRWHFLVLEADVMRFHWAVRNVPRTRATSIGYERLLGRESDYAASPSAWPAEQKRRTLSRPYLPEGWS